MKLLLFNDGPEFEEPFKLYIQEWASEKGKPREDYYGMYKELIADYSNEIKMYVNARSVQRLIDNKPHVRFYWFIDNQNQIVGTIRYRVNIPPEYGNIGYEISPIHRKKGLGKMILKMLIEELRKEEIAKICVTVTKDNLGSIKVIEYNKGIFLGEIYASEGNEYLNQYEIIIT
jgi:predicted acetyltransferase